MRYRVPPRSETERDIQALEQQVNALSSTTGGATDHGALTGLADDDHTQYHNDARGDARYAPIAKGVTNGDSHDHSGGDGAQIAYSSLSGLPTLGTAAAAATTDFAPAAKGVTNGDSHDHSGGDGAQIAYSSLSGLPTLGTAAAQNTTAFEAAGAVATHEADTTSVHGIADTSALLDTADIGVTVQGYDAQLASLAALSYTGNGTKVVRVNAGETAFELASAAGGGDVTGPAASVDSEIALFDSTTGKVLKRATTTGLLKAASGVLAAAVAGTDYPRPFVQVATLAGDQATAANTTPVSLTGLSFSYEANAVYRIWAMGRVAPTAATTGCGFQFDLSSAVTSIDVQFFHQLANTGTLSGGHSIADDASVGVSSGMPGASTYPVTVHGLLRTGANTGTAQMRFRSETTAVTTCKAGFTLVVERVA